MSKGSTDMISEMDDIGDEEFAAMFCKTSSYLLKPLKNAQREKKPSPMKEIRPEIKTPPQRSGWTRKKVRVGSQRDWDIAWNIEERDERVAFSMKDETIVINGKYKRATFMGLPSEINDRILFFYFRGMSCDAKDPEHSYTFLSPSAHLDHSSRRPQIDMSEAVPIPHPLALLHTWSGIYDVAIKTFQRNAWFVSEYQPIDGIEDVLGMRDVLGHHGNVPKMWPNVKRWHLRIVTPDQGELWGRKDFPFHHEDETEDLLTQRVRQHLEVAFKDGNVLEELIVDFGEGMDEILDDLCTPDWALGASRVFIIAVLYWLEGKVKKLSINLQDYVPAYLKTLARMTEMRVAGCDKQDILEVESQYLDDVENRLSEDCSEDVSSEGVNEIEDDVLDIADIYDVTTQSNLLPTENYFPKILEKWMHSQRYSLPHTCCPGSPMPGAKSVVDYTMPPFSDDDTYESSKLKMDKLAEMGKKYLQELGIPDWATFEDWLEILPYFQYKKLLANPKNENDLDQPISDVGIAANRKMPLQETYCLPLIQCSQETTEEWTPVPRTQRKWTPVWINFRSRCVLIGNDCIWDAELKECYKMEGTWLSIHIPSSLCPHRPGVYQLTGINGESTLQNIRNDPQSAEDDLDMFIEQNNNANPWYDGPEDDGLDWLEHEEAFDVGANERLIGEVEFDEWDFWDTQPLKALEVALFGIHSH